MRRYLFIVSWRQFDLYEYLRERFAGDPNVEIILDRRRGERRQQVIPVSVDRRRADRRSRPEADEELRLRSHVVVTLP